MSTTDSRLAELARMIDAWPGLTSQPAAGLIEDSLVLLDFLSEARTVVDVGSGGGLPGLALKLRRPDLEMTLVESDQSKAAFLVQAAARLQLASVDVVARAAEEIGQDPRYRETFDAAVVRALAPMPVLAELCLPLVRLGGRVLAQKTAKENVRLAERAIEILGGMLEAVAPAQSGARTTGTVVVVRKVAATPAIYPRRAGVPRRRPLGA